MATVQVECPNDGLVDAEVQTRTTTPVAVVETLGIVSRQAVDAQMGPLTHGDGQPFMIQEPVLTRDVTPIAEPRQVTVAVCPKCGSPLLQDG